MSRSSSLNLTCLPKKLAHGSILHQVSNLQRCVFLTEDLRAVCLFCLCGRASDWFGSNYVMYVIEPAFSCSKPLHMVQTYLWFQEGLKPKSR